MFRNLAQWQGRHLRKFRRLPPVTFDRIVRVRKLFVQNIQTKIEEVRADPKKLLYHLGVFVNLYGNSMHEMLHYRLVMLCGGVCTMSFFLSLKPPLWGSVFWGVAFGIPNLYYLIKLGIHEIFFTGLNLRKADWEIYEEYFKGNNVTTKQFHTLMMAGERKTLGANETIRARGVAYCDIMLLTSGEVSVSYDQIYGEMTEVETVAKGWLGEMGFLRRAYRSKTGTGTPQINCMTELKALSHCEYILWRDEKLKEVFLEDKALETLLMNTLARTVHGRLHTARHRHQGTHVLTYYKKMLENVLRDDRLSEENRSVMVRYRGKYNILPTEHESILRGLGWSLDDWQNGVKGSTLIADAQRSLDDQGTTKSVENCIYFNPSNLAELSNYFQSPFVDDDNIEWSSAEHYYQAQKFLDDATREYVRVQKTPRKAHDAGTERRPSGIRPDWDDMRTEVIYRAMRWKFRQNPACEEALLETKDKRLVLNDPDNSFWGNGSDGNGSNHLGRILETVRKELINEQSKKNLVM